jgi:hypothetical protein
MREASSILVLLRRRNFKDDPVWSGLDGVAQVRQ